MKVINIIKVIDNMIGYEIRVVIINFEVIINKMIINVVKVIKVQIYDSIGINAN